MNIPQGLPYHAASTAPCWGTTLSKEDGWKVIVKCGNGHIASLALHEIAMDGTVTPSLDCAEPHCDWHHNVVLDGWEKRS